uniref:radical SAM protein n=1 Tax=Frankia sp. CiP1_Cm_nod1 TaxID=2897160 RepID=UPI0020255946
MIPEATFPARFLWLEITGRCQLACVHCYADASPRGSHGTMTAADWRRLIEDAAGHGIEMVQFIGGEPTMHPAFPALVTHSLAAGLRVEVFSNLYRVTPTLWELFSRPGVRLATSY